MKKLLLTFALLLCPLMAQAEEARLDLSSLAQIPIAEEGRVKPLESFARHVLLRLSGREDGAMSWITSVMFNPASAPEQRCFRINNPHVLAALGTSARRDKTYTLGELAEGLSKTADQAEVLSRKKPAELTVDEQALLELHTNILLYGQIIQSLSLVLPLPTLVPDDLQSGLTARPSYLDALRVEPLAMEKLRGFIDNVTPETMTPEQAQLAGFVFTLQKLRESGQNNQTLRVIPSSWKADWLSPWAVLLSGQGSPQTSDLLREWQALANAYQHEDAAAFNTHSATLLQKTLAAQSESNLGARLQAERLYYSLRPYLAASLLLGLAGLLTLVRLEKSGRMALGMGTLMLIAALSTRIYILQRPPVGTLYESVLFVALIVALTALAMSFMAKARGLQAGGSFASGALITLAPFLLNEGESLGVLSAVLNTNLWLTIHVLCITAGYGACILTSTLAHVQLATDRARSLTPHLHRLALIALLLTATGTLLGGVWADQSWGRFWGWDPKENGAMIIVLWLIWLLHGRMGGQLSPRAVTAGLAALAVVVAQAWFGVNLLSVGLHSYGFITGIATALFTFTALDLALIALLWVLSARREKTHAAA